MSPWERNRYTHSLHVVIVFVLAIVVGAFMVYVSGGAS